MSGTSVRSRTNRSYTGTSEVRYNKSWNKFIWIGIDVIDISDELYIYIYYTYLFPYICISKYETNIGHRHHVFLKLLTKKVFLRIS